MHLFAITSILQKTIVALSGLLLVAFTIFHLLGNLLLIQDNQEAFNSYAASLNRFPLLHQTLEVGLAIALLVHISSAIATARLNRQAKPQDYLANPWWRRLADRSMIITGPLLLCFLLVHLQNFRFGPREQYPLEIAGQSETDWQTFVTATFQQPLSVSFYVVMMIPLGIHLCHGITSAGQSLGLVRNPGNWFDQVIAVVVAIGFGVIPLWIYWSH